MLAKLKEYKELISIILFFLGGFFWIQSQFPNKTDLKAELGAVRCQLDNYMKLTQLQILSQELDKQVSELKRKLAEVPANDNTGVAVSPAMKVELEQLKIEYTTKNTQYGQATNEMAKIRDELARGVCARAEL